MTRRGILWVWYQPWGLGGVERFLIEQCRRFLDRGWRVGVAHLAPPDGPLQREYESLAIDSIDFSLIPGAFARRAPSEPACEQVRRGLAGFHPEVIALNGCVDFALACVPLLLRARRMAQVIEFVHVDPPGSSHFLLRRPYAPVVDAIGTSSRSSVERIRQVLGSGIPEVAYVPYGVSLPAAVRGQRQPGEKLKILYVGRIVESQKRVLRIPAILGTLRDLGRDFHVTIAGEGAERPKLEADLGERGLLEHVTFVGFAAREGLGQLFHHNDVLLNTSDSEGFSISVLEAMSAGCVPVCTDVNGRDPEVLCDGKTCRLCPVGEVESLGPILAALSASEIARLSEGAALAAREFTWERTFEGFLGLIDRACARRQVEAWASSTESMLPGVWNMSRENPWLPRRRGPRAIARSMGRALLGMVGR